jgi:hypothetical protein
MRGVALLYPLDDDEFRAGRHSGGKFGELCGRADSSALHHRLLDAAAVPDSAEMIPAAP